MQKTTDHMTIDMNGNKPNSIPQIRDTITQDHSTTTMADKASHTERPTQPVPNSPVKSDFIRSKFNESSDKTSSSEASTTDRLLPFGWDPACISPHPARGPRRTYGSRRPEYYNPNRGFPEPKHGVGRASPPPEAPHQHELDPHHHWTTTQLDPNKYSGMTHVHFQPADVRMPEFRPANITPANRPCVHVYGVSDLHMGSGFFEHSVRALKAGRDEVPWVHGFPMPRMFPAPSGNDGGPSKKAEGKTEDSSLKGKSVRFAGETENNLKASAENEKESIAKKEKKKPAIVASAKEGGKNSLAFILNPVDDFSREKRGKDEENKGREDVKEGK